VIASERQIHKKLEDAQAESKLWEDLAKNAITSSNEELAKEAVGRKFKAGHRIKDYQKINDDVSAQLSILRGHIDILKDKINEARVRQTLIHASENNKTICKNGYPPTETIEDGQDRNNKLEHKDSILSKTSPIRNSDGRIIGAVEIFKDNYKNDEYLEMIKKLKEDSLIDILTSVVNRKYLEQKISGDLNEFNRYGTKLGLLFIDIDHFKEINDNFGHNVGDEILKIVSKTLFRNIRSFDTVGRWGGEEFVVLIHNTEIDMLEKTASKLRSLVNASSYYHQESNKHITVTISIGATISRTGDKPKDIINRADSLMYQSKKTGRNKVTTDLDIE
ncbi:MAG: diguanylate cyclase, partial [Actinobacteria bacterium]|nr:diguanylate cyclase [Actinomycetota bacterium]